MFGYSGKAHKTVVDMAMKMMNEAGRFFVFDLLGDAGDALDEASVWADTREAETKYPVSHRYHFSHTPYRACADFELARDCRGNVCIVTALSDAIGTTLDNTSSKEDRADAFKFILHLMADIHQPLHTGFLEDLGGNTIILGGKFEGVSLHEFWDKHLLIEYMSMKKFSDWHQVSEDLFGKVRGKMDIIRRINSIGFGKPSDLTVPEERIAYIIRIASETSTTTTCKSAYMSEEYIENGHIITDKYLMTRYAVLGGQLTRSGVRLAALIEAIALVWREHKQSIRAARITDLMNREAIPSPTASPLRASSNRFLALEMDFDGFEKTDSFSPREQVEKLFSPSAGRSAAPKTKKGSTQDGEEFLEEFIRSQEANRKLYVIDGVDLRNLVLHNFLDTMLVTSETQLAQNGPNYSPISTVEFEVQFGLLTSITKSFHFDGNVFRFEISDDLVVRCLLRLKGIDVDLTTDISDYWKTDTSSLAIKPAGGLCLRSGFAINFRSFTPSEGDIIRTLDDRLIPHFRSEMHVYSGREPSTSAKLMKLRGKIIVFVHANLRWYIHQDTLRSTMRDPQQARRFFLHSYWVDENSIVTHLLVDPKIWKSSFYRTFPNALEEIATRPQYTGIPAIDRMMYPDTIQDELVDMKIFLDDETHFSFSKNAKHISIMVVYGSYPTVDDISRMASEYRIFDWGLRGIPIHNFSQPMEMDLYRKL